MTVWIIEDNARFRGYLKEFFNETEDLRCTGDFSNCEDALANLNDSTAPCILLIDLGLPGMSGIQGIPEFKTRFPEIEILVLTVNNTREKVFEAISAGASGYLLKSTSFDEVTDGCRKIACGEASLDGSIARMMLDSFQNKKQILPSKKYKEHNLTDRELEILKLLADGYYVKEITDKLEISQSTVKFHCHNLYRKLHAQSQRSAIYEAHRRGIL
jgi:DNA-binding NarL/FixJ family response regulator